MTFSLIDDRDPKITYTGTWNLGGTPNEHNGTVSSSTKVGNHFSVPFTGSAIGVYGTFDSSSAGVETSYEIDGGPTTTVTSPSSGTDSYQKLFWQSDPVGTGPHTLVVSMVAVNTGPGLGVGEGTVWFDYFNVTHADSAQSPPKTTSHAALIGGVTAGVVVLIIAAGLLFLYFRRKRKQRSTLSATAITPLPTTMAEAGPPRAASSGKRGHANPDTTPTPTSPQSSYGPSESQSQSHALGSASTYTADTGAHSDSIADLKRRQQQVVRSYEAGLNSTGGAVHATPPIQHVDSGMRELTVPRPAGPPELPPIYTAV
ncbi:hypothetical protein K438DRAFT_1966735 [Mycena galopus ATCC 62051]|nr:hypothetical protein K438DRAFT_1966735 [Mycena galopus ATCC 62051]